MSSVAGFKRRNGGEMVGYTFNVSPTTSPPFLRLKRTYRIRLVNPQP